MLRYLILYIALSYQMNLFLLEDTEAICLDGSKGSYYFEQGSDTGIDKWLIFFEGGAWIGGNTMEETLLSALDRSKSWHGSSNYLGKTKTLGGILSRSESVNPGFHNWNYVFINYCDGTGHQGYSTEPYEVQGLKLYFRGEKIVKSIINKFTEQLSIAEKVVVSGCSAGGLGAFTWTEYIRDRLPQTTQVLSIPDSGIFQDFPAFDGSQDYKTSYQLHFMDLVNKETDPPNGKCVEANKNQKWKCLFAQYLVKYISTPMFIIQSVYDTWCIPNILKLSCADNGSLGSCTNQERSFIESHSTGIKIILNGKMQERNDSGAFAPACTNHCFLKTNQKYSQTLFQVPEGSGNTISVILNKWINNQIGDYNYIDKVIWPNNSKCSYNNNIIDE